MSMPVTPLAAAAPSARSFLPPASVAIVGLGYVGLPLALLFADAGFAVTGLDIDDNKVVRLNRGASYIRHIADAAVEQALQSRRFQASGDFDRLAGADAIIMCVPTPLDERREPDLSYIVATAESVRARLQPGQLVILESSTYPGTTEEVLKPLLEASGMRADDGSGRGFLLAFSPEREDPGNKRYTTRQIPKLVGGYTQAARDAAVALYGAAFERVIPVSSCQVAEMAKLLENIYRCVNIALVNELKLLCHRMGLDPFEVVEAAATKPFGFQPFFPGPGLGGHCIPIDPYYLSWKAREFDFSTRFIELAGEINTAMPYYVVQRVSQALSQKSGRALRGANILILGVSYKKDIDDLRESPSLKLLQLLAAEGAHVQYNDPYCPLVTCGRHYCLNLKSIPYDAESLRSYDCVLIATDHSCYDYAMITANAPLVVDTRNATRGCTGTIVHA